MQGFTREPCHSEAVRLLTILPAHQAASLDFVVGALAGTAGPSHVCAQVVVRANRSQRTQAVAVRETSAPSRQSLINPSSSTLAGLDWAKQRSGSWQAEGARGCHLLHALCPHEELVFDTWLCYRFFT